MNAFARHKTASVSERTAQFIFAEFPLNAEFQTPNAESRPQPRIPLSKR